MSTDAITTTRITIVDSKGNARITLDGGDESGYASICLFSVAGPSIQLSAQPSGIVSITLDQLEIGMALTLGPKGIAIRDSAGRLGVTIGDPFCKTNGAIPSLTVYRDGLPVYTLPPEDCAEPQ